MKLLDLKCGNVQGRDSYFLQAIAKSHHRIRKASIWTPSAGKVFSAGVWIRWEGMKHPNQSYRCNFMRIRLTRCRTRWSRSLIGCRRSNIRIVKLRKAHHSSLHHRMSRYKTSEIVGMIEQRRGVKWKMISKVAFTWSKFSSYVLISNVPRPRHEWEDCTVSWSFWKDFSMDLTLLWTNSEPFRSLKMKRKSALESSHPPL